MFSYVFKMRTWKWYQVSVSVCVWHSVGDNTTIGHISRISKGHWTTCSDSQTLSPLQSDTDGTKPRGELSMKSGYMALQLEHAACGVCAFKAWTSRVLFLSSHKLPICCPHIHHIAYEDMHQISIKSRQMLEVSAWMHWTVLEQIGTISVHKAWLANHWQSDAASCWPSSPLTGVASWYSHLAIQQLPKLDWFKTHPVFPLRFQSNT